MKLNKLILPLALALIATLATTGCKHGFNGKTTLLPGQKNQLVANNDRPETISPTQPFDPGQPPVTTVNPNQPPGTFETSTNIDITKYDLDRTTLAPYIVHFKFDSAVVQDKEQANIASVAQALSDPSLALQIEGHCDERGTEEYNRSLGERRALALREALAKINVNPARILTISYGKDKPVDPGHDEAAWSKNRRGEFILLHPKGSAPVQ